MEWTRLGPADWAGQWERSPRVVKVWAQCIGQVIMHVWVCMGPPVYKAWAQHIGQVVAVGAGMGRWVAISGRGVGPAYWVGHHVQCRQWDGESTSGQGMGPAYWAGC